MALSNTCNCPKPPGGQAVCEPSQLAICRVRDGEAQALCLNPPSAASLMMTMEAQLELANWALSAITGEERDSSQQVSDDEVQMLRNGTLEDPAQGLRVTFSVPASLWLALQEEVTHASVVHEVESSSSE